MLKKLNIGCGKNKLEGYINLDFRGDPDIVHDLYKQMPFDDNSMDELVAYHVIEHFPRKHIYLLLKSWLRVLKPGGKLVFEFPDCDKVFEWYLKDKSELAMEWIYGNQEDDGQTHYWGYNKETMKIILEDQRCLEQITFTEPQDYHKNEGPVLRVEAIKKR